MRTIELCDRLREMRLQVAIEIVGARGGVQAARVEAGVAGWGRAATGTTAAVWVGVWGVAIA